MEKIKNYLELGSLLFGILLANLSCQRDDFDNINETVKERSIQKISLAQFETKMNNSKNYSKLSKLFDIYKNSNDVNYKTLQSTDSLFLITDNIIMIDNQDIISYTFKINSNSTNLFYNLVLDTDSNGNILSSSIIEYTPSFEWLNNPSLPFTGIAEIYENDIFSLTSLSNLMSSRNSDDCLTGVSGHWECGDNNNHEPGNPSCTPYNNAQTEYIIDLSYGPCDSSNNISYEYSFGGGGDDADEYSGGGSGGGAGSSTSPNISLSEEELSLKKECNKIKKILQKNNPDYISKVRNLKNKDNLDFESSVAIFDDNSVSEYQGVQGSTNVQTLPSSPSTDYVSMAHVHNETDSIKTYSVPSLLDLQWIARRYKDGYINSYNYVSFLATADGTYFALTIDDGNKLWDFFRYMDALNMSVSLQERIDAANYHATIYKPIIEKYYDHKTNPLIKENAQGSSNNEQQLKYFMQFLEEADAGITVFESDENFNNFTKLELDGLIVKRNETPCQF